MKGCKQLQSFFLPFSESVTAIRHIGLLFNWLAEKATKHLHGLSGMMVSNAKARPYQKEISHPNRCYCRILILLTVKTINVTVNYFTLWHACKYFSNYLCEVSNLDNISISFCRWNSMHSYYNSWSPTYLKNVCLYLGSGDVMASNCAELRPLHFWAPSFSWFLGLSQVLSQS